MKQIEKLTLLLLVAVLLVACGDNNGGGGETVTKDIEQNKETDEAVQADMDEILQKSVLAMADVMSFTTKMEADQEMGAPDGSTFASKTSVEMRMVQDPLAFYQILTATGDEIGEVESEMYFVDGAMYFKESMEDMWYKYPEELAEMFGDLGNMNIDPEAQLQLLQHYAEHLSLEEDDQHYIVTIVNDSEAMNDISQELFATAGEQTAELGELADMLSFKDVSYTLFIDKGTYLQSKVDMTFLLDFVIEGETSQIRTKTNATFTDFDEVEEIEIPQQVIDGAVDFNFNLDMDQFEQFDLAELEGIEE